MLVSEPRPSFEHGRCVARISAILLAFVESRRLGVVVAGDPGFVLARRPDTVRGPDVAFVTSGRAKEIDLARPFFPGAPDLAVEVLSPNDRVNEVLAKVTDYLAAGCRMVWVVDPALAELSVFRSPFSPRVLCGEDMLDGEDVLPGFALPVQELFAT